MRGLFGPTIQASSLGWEDDLSVCRVERKVSEAGAAGEEGETESDMGREAGTDLASKAFGFILCAEKATAEF